MRSRIRLYTVVAQNLRKVVRGCYIFDPHERYRSVTPLDVLTFKKEHRYDATRYLAPGTGIDDMGSAPRRLTPPPRSQQGRMQLNVKGADKRGA